MSGANVVDSSGWLEYFTDSDSASLFASAIEDAENLFVPVISAATQARHEGYFRLEWNLAVERAKTIAETVPFIVPVALTALPENEALVPERFLQVQ